MAYSRTHYGTGYYIYQQFIPGTVLSQPIKAWDGKTPPDKDILELINRAGSDLAPGSDAPGVVAVGAKDLSLGKNGNVLLKSIRTAGPAMLRAIEFSVPRDQAIAFGRAQMRITWDGLADASVDAPVALFFGAGTLYNRDKREFLVKAFPVHIQFGSERVNLACYFPMPFFQSATIQLLGNGQSDLSDVTWSARYQPLQ